MEMESDVVMMDGSDIMKLVDDEEAFTTFVDHKFKDLDKDSNGKLSAQELKPAVADIGIALGLPPQGSSPESDHIYSEVLEQFTRGTQHEVSKTEFKQVFSDILLGMAAGLKRHPVVILRLDGDDLLEFIKSPSFEPEMVSIFYEINRPDGSLREVIAKAFGKLYVEKGMPPTSDPWVMSNVVEPAIQSCGGIPHQPVSQEIFLAEFKKVAESVARHLKEQPVIVAHSENTFDGSGIKKLLSNKFELDKALEIALKGFPKDNHATISKEHFRVALDILAPFAGLPPLGAVHEVDQIITDALKTCDADDEKTVKEDEFKKLLTEVLGSMMLQLEGNPIAVSTNSVVHGTPSSSSTLFQTSST